MFSLFTIVEVFIAPESIAIEDSTQSTSHVCMFYDSFEKNKTLTVVSFADSGEHNVSAFNFCSFLNQSSNSSPIVSEI